MESPSVKLASEKAADDAQARRVASVKFYAKTLTYMTTKRVELYNITPEVEALVKASGISEGFLSLSSLHTTTALFINEYQNALIEDIKCFLERFVGEADGYTHRCDKHLGPSPGYKHNCEYCSDCDRKNADAHLGAMLLGHNLCLPIASGKLVLGRWQNIILAELDGPRERLILAHIIGS